MAKMFTGLTKDTSRLRGPEDQNGSRVFLPFPVCGPTFALRFCHALSSRCAKRALGTRIQACQPARRPASASRPRSRDLFQDRDSLIQRSAFIPQLRDYLSHIHGTSPVNALPRSRTPYYGFGSYYPPIIIDAMKILLGTFFMSLTAMAA